MRPARLFVAAALCVFALPAVAHEFWIDATKYQVENGENIVAHFRNGQKFKGTTLAYFENRTVRYDVVSGDQVIPVVGRMGDIPALDMAVPEGLAVVVHQTTPSSVTYRTWEKFQIFADHKDFPDIKARHLARGLPEETFKETYARFAKSLIGVGESAGQDVVTGMETEFVALANPYTDDLSDGLPVQLFYQGSPRSDAQVEVFDRAPDKTVTITLLRTDALGKALVPVSAGHSYLIDAVVLREVDDGKAVWESLWAALTFAVP